jgi:ATP-binding cassette subfamily B (MDR/TAP) protein 1
LQIKIKNKIKQFFLIKKGCGKSTVVSLLLRFYDVDSGAIYLDGIDIRKLNLNWLRSNIGVVSQEPVLFNTTIFENIAYGDIKNKRNETRLEEIIDVAVKSNIHNRIETLPDVISEFSIEYLLRNINFN